MRARVNYHLRRPRAEILAGAAGQRVIPETEQVLVDLHDARGDGDAPRYARDGLVFVVAPSRAGYLGDDDDDAGRARYDRELTALLTREVGATAVHVFDHTTRVEGATRGPARHAHSDYNAAGAAKRLREVLQPAEAEVWARGHYAFVNVWRPLHHPVEQVPLGFALPRSVADEDWIDIDMVYAHRRGQILGLVASPAHHWVYLSRMRPDEVAIFNVCDSAGRAPVAHAALDLVDAPSDARPRQSLESRVVVRLP